MERMALGSPRTIGVSDDNSSVNERSIFKTSTGSRCR